MLTVLSPFLSQFPKNTNARELERIFSRYRGFERLEHNIKWAYVDFAHESFAKEAMEDLNKHTNLIVSYAKPGAGEMKPQRLDPEFVALMHLHAARQRAAAAALAAEEIKRLSGRGAPLDELARINPPADVENLSQYLTSLSISDQLAKRQTSPGNYDVSPRLTQQSGSPSPTLLPMDRRSSAPLMLPKELGVSQDSSTQRSGKDTLIIFLISLSTDR